MTAFHRSNMGGGERRLRGKRNPGTTEYLKKNCQTKKEKITVVRK